MAREKRLPPIHPGEILLEEFLKPLDMSMNQLAIALRVPASRINAIVEGKRSISADTALRLGHYFGISPEFWINLQANYDLRIARREFEEQIKRDIRPRKSAA
ncbi:MAG: HigA family addiction module antitoxin [Candidatus Binatus sp.]|uniref:HigA family addiction module antitoxin n=1 Tax=Candidatus Binatus sp. TaxID=2811406 RepID=UPI003BB01C18